MGQVGLLIFSESRAREDVYQQRKPLQAREVKRFVDALQPEVQFFIPTCGEIRSKKDVRNAVAEIERAGVDAVILYIPIFIPPVLVAHAGRLLSKPTILMGNRCKDTLSSLGQLAAGGAIDQIGLPCRRMPRDISDEQVKRDLLRYLNVLRTANQLKGSTFGCLGGRSLGISTGTADGATWERLFGVDIEHVDQYQIVFRAEQAPPDKVALYKKWITGNYGAINYQEGRFGEAHLERAIRGYLAVKSIIHDYELDFLGIKCQPEMSNHFVLQCLAIQMLNDPYDAEGPKEPIACSCEADADGALTMQIMKLLSGGRVTALQDIAYIGDREMVLANCGSMASYFAGLSADPKDNLQEVHLQPHGFGQAGGCSTQFVAAVDTLTYARLFRKEGQYHMAVLKGRTVKKPRETLKEYSWYRPTSFVEIDIDSDRFMSEYGSNHMHCVQGDYIDDLVEFCKYHGICCHVY